MGLQALSALAELRSKERRGELRGRGSIPTFGEYREHYLHHAAKRPHSLDALHDLQKWDYLIGKYRRLRRTAWADFLAESEDPVDQLAWVIEFGEPEKTRWYDRLRHLFSNSPISVTDTLLRRCVSSQTHQQMVVTALAISRYRLAHGDEPSDLEALVPDYLAEPPKDLMDGGVLRYGLRPEGGFLLYSVGVDGADDGGDPAPEEPGGHYMNIWHGRDALWPVAASPEESATALEPSHE